MTVPVQKDGLERKEVTPEVLFTQVSAWEGSRDKLAAEEGIIFFSPESAALQSWLIAQDINRGIFAFSLYYKLNYQMRSLRCTVYNDIFLEVGIADYFKSRYNLPTVQCSYGITCHYKEFNFTFILHYLFSCVKYTYLYLDKSKLINICGWSYFSWQKSHTKLKF